MAVAKQSELRVTYSIGVKVNIGNYESADAHLSRGETWDVSDLTDDEAQALFDARFAAIRDELGRQVETEYKELKS